MLNRAKYQWHHGPIWRNWSCTALFCFGFERPSHSICRPARQFAWIWAAHVKTTSQVFALHSLRKPLVTCLLGFRMTLRRADKEHHKEKEGPGAPQPEMSLRFVASCVMCWHFSFSKCFGSWCKTADDSILAVFDQFEYLVVKIARLRQSPADQQSPAPWMKQTNLGSRFFHQKYLLFY